MNGLVVFIGPSAGEGGQCSEAVAEASQHSHRNVFICPSVLKLTAALTRAAWRSAMRRLPQPTGSRSDPAAAAAVDVSAVVCVVAVAPAAAEAADLLRRGKWSRLRRVPLMISVLGGDLPPRDAGATWEQWAASQGARIVSTLDGLAAQIAALPSLEVMRSASAAGGLKGLLVDLANGPFASAADKDIAFSDHHHFMLRDGNRQSWLPWYKHGRGHQEHISNLESYVEGLLPVHRCRPGTFLAILREGGLASRTEVQTLVSADNRKSSAACRVERHVVLRNLSSREPFLQHRRAVFAYAQALLERLEVGADTGTVRVEETLWGALMGGDKTMLKAAAAEAAGDALLAAREGGLTGVGYGKDVALGTNRHVFATLGPNRGFGYGSVVLVLKKQVLWHPDTWISPLACTGYLKPYNWVFCHRPWAGAGLACDGAGTPDLEAADPSTFPEKPEDDEEGVLACVHSAVNVAATTDCFRVLANEIDAMCHFLAFGHRQAYEFDSGEWRSGLDWRKEEVREAARAKLRGADGELRDDAWRGVVEYYESKDPHTLCECHLPAFVPVAAIEKIILPDSLLQERSDIKAKVDSWTLPDGRRLRDITVTTNSDAECMQWQQDWFEQRRRAACADASSSLVARGPCPISVQVSGRMGRPVFLPVDFGFWFAKGAQEYEEWKDESRVKLRVAFCSQATHDVRVFFSSTATSQREDANLHDESWRSTTYHICLGAKRNTESYITKGILGTRHAVHEANNPSVRLTGMSETGVWERYWFEVEAIGDSARVRCGRGPFGANIMMEMHDSSPIRGLKYIGLSCWNEPTFFCDVRTDDANAAV